jgi:hypothetical protein
MLHLILFHHRFICKLSCLPGPHELDSPLCQRHLVWGHWNGTLGQGPAFLGLGDMHLSWGPCWCLPGSLSSMPCGCEEGRGSVFSCLVFCPAINNPRLWLKFHFGFLFEGGKRFSLKNEMGSGCGDSLSSLLLPPTPPTSASSPWLCSDQW